MRTIKFVLWSLGRIKNFILISFLVISISMNIVLFVGGSFFAALNTGFEAFTGIKTISSRNRAQIATLGDQVALERQAKREVKGQLRDTTAELADAKLAKRQLTKQTKDLSADLVAERKMKRELRGQVADISSALVVARGVTRNLKAEVKEQASELATMRVTNRQLKSQVRDLGMGLVPFKGKKVALKTAVDETAEAVGSRALRTARREVASMPGEAIPYLGTAVIVTATALEVADLCATLKDMSALKKAFNPDLESSPEELEVCAIKIPPKDELVEIISRAPGQAWSGTIEALPTIDDLKSMELPDTSVEKIWDGTMKAGENLWVKTMDGSLSLYGKVGKWWNGD